MPTKWLELFQLICINNLVPRSAASLSQLTSGDQGRSDQSTGWFILCGLIGFPMARGEVCRVKSWRKLDSRKALIDARGVKLNLADNLMRTTPKLQTLLLFIVLCVRKRIMIIVECIE